MDYIRNVLPKELIDLTVSLMDNKTKRNIRATNRYWLSCVKLTEFQIHFASTTNLPQIVHHFAKCYENQPITMSFRKSVILDVSFSIHHFTALTNLIALDLDFHVPDFTILYALSNLQRLSGTHIGTVLTNLTSLDICDESYIPTVRNYTNLQCLNISFYANYHSDPFMAVANPSRLTKLTISMPKIEFDSQNNNSNFMRQFNNLKVLKLSVCTKRTLSLLLPHLTGLEKLMCRGELTNDIFTLTRLTHLHLDNGYNEEIDEIDFHNISALQKLKYFEVYDVSALTSEFSFLSYLTNIEDYATETNKDAMRTLDHLNSKKLTRLSMLGLKNSFKTEHLPKLSTLLELTTNDFFFHLQNFSGCSAALTKLTIRCIATPTGLYSPMLFGLKNLRSLTVWTYPVVKQLPEGLSLQILPNLEFFKLQCAPSQTMYNDLQYLTRLTYLEFSLTADVFKNNTTVLNNLPLRTLVFRKNIVAPEIWSLVTQLRDLECLQVWRVDSEEIIESFSVLTKLTSLTMKKMRKRIVGIHLTKLTNLQRLVFRPRPRKYYARKPEDFFFQNGMTRLHFYSLNS